MRIPLAPDKFLTSLASTEPEQNEGHHILTADMRGCPQGPDAWFTGTVWITDNSHARAAIAAQVPPRLPLAAGQRGTRIQWDRRCMYWTDSAWYSLPAPRAHPSPRNGKDRRQRASRAAPGRTMTHIAVQETGEHGVDVASLEHVFEHLSPQPPAI